MSQNYSKFVSHTSTKLINVSNKYNVQNNELNFKKTSLHNYNDVNKLDGNFEFDLTLNTPNDFGNSIKLFDEKTFATNNIVISNLKKIINLQRKW